MDRGDWPAGEVIQRPSGYMAGMQANPRHAEALAWALVAPHEIPHWFEPSGLPPKPAYPHLFDGRGLPREPTPLESARIEECNEWEAGRLRACMAQWPWAFARMVLEARPAEFAPMVCFVPKEPEPEPEP